jgi:adenylylsulfate kinase
MNHKPRKMDDTMTDGKARIYWFTGLSGSGKTSLSRTVATLLAKRGVRSMVLDGDVLRTGLCADLSFTPADRAENIRRAGEVARLFSSQGTLCLCAFITPYQAMRDQLRARLGASYREISIQCPLTVCMERDPKGNYRRAKEGELHGYTGVDAPYEPPVSPDLRVETENISVEENALRILEFILRTTP